MKRNLFVAIIATASILMPSCTKQLDGPNHSRDKKANVQSPVVPRDEVQGGDDDDGPIIIKLQSDSTETF